jgi:hypothetical protein
MKKFLSTTLVLFLIWNSNSFAEQLSCKIEKAYKCNSGDCVEFNSETNLSLNTDTNIYERRDRKGSDEYNANVYKSGSYIIAEIQGGTLLKIEVPSLQFVEVASLGLNTYNNFGKCGIK